MKTVKDDMLSDAIATAFELSRKNIILKRVIIALCVLIACLIAFILCR